MDRIFNDFFYGGARAIFLRNLGLASSTPMKANQMYCGRGSDPNAVIETRFIPIVIRKRRIGGTWSDETSNEARRTGTEMIRQVFANPFQGSVKTSV